MSLLLPPGAIAQTHLVHRIPTFLAALACLVAPGLVPAATAATGTSEASSVTLDAPRRVTEGKAVTLRIRWVAASGLPVSGPVVVRERDRGRWRRVADLITGADGLASVGVAPRRIVARYRVETTAVPGVEATTSGVRRVRLLPLGDPVRLPRSAPRPRIALPAQPMAVGSGAHPVVTAIPGGVWSEMTGRSWHAGCPVGRSGLRLLRINYWDYDGFRRRGELIAARGAIGQMAAALAEMYDARLPIRSMYRVDRFGWSPRLHGADDYASMAAGNTSAFNCRTVVNLPGVRSPHSSGRSLDLNTWENPYRSATGLVPNRWWQSRSDPRVAWRSRGHSVVQIMARHGLRWTYGLGDTQHFDAR